MRRPILSRRSARGAAATLRLCLGVTLLGVTPPSAVAAGFDCGRAKTPDERAVCADPQLSDLDSRLARAYGQAKATDMAAEARGVARAFLADRAACGSARACLVGHYLGALEALAQLGAADERPSDLTAEDLAGGGADPGGALPRAIGRCAATTVAAVHPRLGDDKTPPTDADYDAGTGIEFGNGGYQVSYAREPALIASRPGDPVIMCLIAIPRGCPPGDDRGRVYLVTNQRTGASWSLADSQHMCGGA